MCVCVCVFTCWYTFLPLQFWWVVNAIFLSLLLLAISKLVLAHGDLREQILVWVIDEIDRECACLCQRGASPTSAFRKIPLQNLADFKWSGCTDELQRKAPVRVFSKIVSSNDHRNQQKRGDRHLPGICTAIAMLLKESISQLSYRSALIPRKRGTYTSTIIVVHACTLISISDNYIYTT